KGDGKDQADAKKDAKEKSASNSRASARVPHRYYNYYAGRHYGGYRGHHYGWDHPWESLAPRYYILGDLCRGGTGFQHLTIGARRVAASLLCGLVVLNSNFGSRTLQALTSPPTLCPATRYCSAKRSFNELHPYRHLTCRLDRPVYGGRVSDRRRQRRLDRAHHHCRD